MDLSGRWRAHPADDGLRRIFPGATFDDADWPELTVPGHWASSAPFAGHNGPVLYRRRFDVGADARDDDATRHWLVFDGICALGDVWLDGAYLGATEGYFIPHELEVSRLLRTDGDDHGEHVLAVEVSCPRPPGPPSSPGPAPTLTGALQSGPGIDPDWNPGGIWRPVRLERSGPIRITQLAVRCTEATEHRAVLELRAVLDAANAGPAPVRTTVRTAAGDLEQVAERSLAAGENRLAWSVSIDDPRLWWPRALGSPDVCRVAVEIAGSDRRQLVTGLRSVQLDGWHLHVNGERLFCKGATLGPTRLALADATPAEIAADIHRADEAGLDLLRVHAHIGRPELYEAADATGLLLWQDLPLRWAMARGTRRQAVRQARGAVDLLGHHPSIVLWCGHDQPFPAQAVATGKGARRLARLALPGWNRTVLDHSVRRALSGRDPTRPVLAHTGVPPNPWRARAASHLGTGRGDEMADELPRLIALWPRLAGFVAELGTAQGVPDGLGDSSKWPDLDWDHLGEAYGLDRARLDRAIGPPQDHASFAAWRHASQRHQAEIVKHHVETLRRLKYRPTGGFCIHSLADAAPAISTALLDHRRAPKAAWTALTDACRPVIVVADHPRPVYRPGEPVVFDVHVVSDLRTQLDDARVEARLGGESWSWAGEVPPDSCVRVGTIQTLAPAHGGPLVLELTLRWPGEAGGGEAVANRYESRVRSIVHARSQNARIPARR